METLSRQPYYLFFILISTIGITSAYVHLLPDRVRLWPYILVLLFYLGLEAAAYLFFLFPPPPTGPYLETTLYLQGQHEALAQLHVDRLAPFFRLNQVYRLGLGLIYASVPSLLTDIFRRLERRRSGSPPTDPPGGELNA